MGIAQGNWPERYPPIRHRALWSMGMPQDLDPHRCLVRKPWERRTLQSRTLASVVSWSPQGTAAPTSGIVAAGISLGLWRSDESFEPANAQLGGDLLRSERQARRGRCPDPCRRVGLSLARHAPKFRRSAGAAAGAGEDDCRHRSHGGSAGEPDAPVRRGHPDRRLGATRDRANALSDSGRRRLGFSGSPALAA